MAKNVVLSASLIKKIEDIKSQGGAFARNLSEREIIEAVFSRTAEEIVSFIENGVTKSKPASVAVTTSTPGSRTVKIKSNRRRNIKRLPNEWRTEKMDELTKNRRITVKNAKEAQSLYNHVRFLKLGTITYSTKKRGGVEVVFVPTV